MASVLRESLNLFQDIGFLNVLLPFIFVYVVVLATLEKTKVLGTENGKSRTNLNSMAAFVLAFSFIAFASKVETLTQYLQVLGMASVFVMSLLFLIAAFQADEFFNKKNYIYTIALIFVIVAFFYIVGLFNSEKFSFILDLIFNPVVIVVLCFYAMVMYITSGKVKKEKGNVKEAEKEVEKYSSEKKDINEKT